MNGSRRLDWPVLSASVLHELTVHRERLNAVDQAYQNHGDQLLELWQLLDAVVRAHPAERPPALFEPIERALELRPESETLHAYRNILKRQQAAWLAGELDEERLILLAQRLLHGNPEHDVGNGPLAGALAGLIRSLGGTARAQRLAERFGVADLLAGGLDLTGGNPGAALQAGVAFLVGQSPLAARPHLAESGRLVLRTLLLEIDRQARHWPPDGD